MTTEQTSSADEDHVIHLKALEKAWNWTSRKKTKRDRANNTKWSQKMQHMLQVAVNKRKKGCWDA